MTRYDSTFFLGFRGTSHDSAQQVVPIVMDLLQPRSVVDVGCGLGGWLAEFQRQGVERILGVDGDYVDREHLLIDRSLFRPHDVTLPLPDVGRFDLAMSLEVGEHLPASAADTFVGTLTSLAPVVFFSAAIPFQGGTHHVNEQWPEYWAELFAKRGYRPVDYIRSRVWDNEKVAYYYAQNMLLFASPDALAANPRLAAELVTEKRSLARVHPKQWLTSRDPSRQRLRWLATAVPRSLTFAITQFLNARFGRRGS
jgi:SAM-dependent methyltransferase